MSYNLENKSANEIELFLSTDLEKGLDKKAVQARLKHRREGKLPTKDISFLGVVFSAVFRPSFAVLSIGLIMAYYMCDALEAVFCTVLAALYFAAVIYFDYVSRLSEFRHRRLFLQSYDVIRSGTKVQTKSCYIVEGDVVFYRAGDIVPYLSYIVSCNEDFKIENDVKLLESGTKILTGSCKCIVVDSARKRQGVSEKQSVFYNDQKNRIKKLSFLLCGIAVLFAVFAFLRDGDGKYVFSVFTFLSIILCGAIPEFFDECYALLFKRHIVDAKVLVNGKESLGKLSSLECVVLDGNVFFNDEKFSPFCFFANGNVLKNKDISKTENLSLAKVVANTEKFLPNSLFKDNSAFASFVEVNSSVSFREKDETFKFDTVLFEGADYKKAYVRGRLVDILDCSAKCNFNGKTVALDNDAKANILNNAERFLAKGFSVVAYACTENPEITLSSSHIIHKKLVFCGFFVCKKTVNDECEKFFDVFERDGIQPIVFIDGTAENVALSFSETPSLAKMRMVDCKGANATTSLAEKLLTEYDVFLNADEKMRNVILHVIRENEYRMCILSNAESGECENAFSSVLMAKTIDMDNPSWKYQKFDAIVDNKIHSILVMFEKIHQIKSRVISIIDYFVFSIATKVFISLLGLVFGVSVFSISQIALLTFLLDYFAVYTLIEAKFSDRKTETLTDFSNVKDVLSFFLLPLLLVLSGFILKPFVNAPLQDVVIAVSLIFQVLLSTYCVLFRSCVAISEKSISFAAGCLFFSLSCVFFAPLGEFFSVVGGVASFLGAFCVLVVFIILITIFKKIKFTYKEKEINKNERMYS